MTPGHAALLVVVGALASGINAVAGGGSLLSFPTLRIVIGLESTVANATNSVALWPGSLSGAFGFKDAIARTKRHLRTLMAPTIVGSACGAELLVHTDAKTFDRIVPWLILLAAGLLLFQPKIKGWVMRGGRTPHAWAGIVMQFLVSLYGGYFGAGMGIMMLAAFAFYMEGTIHELNAVKNWLGLAINVVCSALFLVQGLIDLPTGAWLALGSIVGGFYAAKLSQRVNPDKMRLVIAVYGVGMAVYYALRQWL